MILTQLGSTGTKFQENAPGSSFIETDKEHAMFDKMVTYAVPVPAMKEKGTIANVPFQTQQGTPLVQIINKRYSVYTGLTNHNRDFLNNRIKNNLMVIFANAVSLFSSF